MLSHFLVRSRLIRRGWVESFVNRWNALRISPNWLHVWNNLMLCCVCSSSLIPVVEQNKKSHRLSFFVLRSDTCGASLAVFYVSIVDERFGKAWKIWFLRSSQVIFPFLLLVLRTWTGNYEGQSSRLSRERSDWFALTAWLLISFNGLIRQISVFFSHILRLFVSPVTPFVLAATGNF